jgi:nucleotide-binding universal stress UspA family protein
VLSAVDMREGSVRAVHFALALFPAARHHLLYALDPGQESVPNGDVQDEDRLRRMNESRYSRAEQALQQLALRLSALALHPVRADVADDEPARAILVGAADLPADCVVVGHHGQGVATDRFLGSMARHVIHSAISDVLVVP